MKRLSLEDARRRAIRNLTVGNLCQALDENHVRTKRELLEIFRCDRFVCLSIHGVTIYSRKFLNFDVTNPISSIAPLTSDFLGRSSMTTSDFIVGFVNMLHRMEADGLCVAGIMSDGCSFQIAGLSWRAPLSIQATHPEYSKLIVLPCVCHRLQNSITELFHNNPLSAKMISAARLVSVYLCKPRCWDVLHAACPTHCPTRWIYDYPLLQFLLGHEEIAFDLIRHNNANSNMPISFPYEIFVFLPLIGKVFHLIPEMEQDDARLSQVYLMITEFLSSLKREAENVDACIGISLDDHLLNDLDASTQAQRNDYEVKEGNSDL
jgi:hypothetical protein